MNDEKRLESWKEIAEHLGRNTTTARRWEREEGLPVHRHPHKSRASVYAYPSEIDAWRAGRKIVPEPVAKPLWKIPAFALTMLLCLVMVGNGVRPVSAQQARTAFREVWQLPTTATVSGAISRDGRYFPYIDWGQNGNLFLHDFASGKDRPLTNTATDSLPQPKLEQFALNTSFSRDGRQLAYSWYRGDTNRFELRLMDPKGDGIPQPRLLSDPPDLAAIAPGDWSADGKSIAVMILRQDKTGQIGIVSVPDGALRVLKSVDWRGTTVLALSPDGKYLAYDLPANDSTEKRDVFVIAIDGSREVSAVVSPSQDTAVGWSNDGKRLLFASDRSGSMGLWSVAFADGRIEGQPQLVRADIGDVASLGLTDSGTLYAGVNASGSPNVPGDVYVASINFATGQVLSPPVLAAETYVGNNALAIWSRDGKYLAYVSRRGAVGSSLAIASHFVFAVRSMDTGEIREISPSPGIDLVGALRWASDESLVLAGRDAKGRYGIFMVNTRTGRSSLVVQAGERQNPPGLAGVSSDGKRVYYLVHNFDEPASTTHLMEKDLAAGGERELRTINGGGGLSPDGRYFAFRGAGAKPSLSILPSGGGELRELSAGIDGFRRMTWAPDSSAVYVLAGRSELWRFPVDGSQPRKLDLKWDPSYPELDGFMIHPDGQRVAFQARSVKKATEVWALENFLPTWKGK